MGTDDRAAEQSAGLALGLANLAVAAYLGVVVARLASD